MSLNNHNIDVSQVYDDDEKFILSVSGDDNEMLFDLTPTQNFSFNNENEIVADDNSNLLSDHSSTSSSSSSTTTAAAATAATTTTSITTITTTVTETLSLPSTSSIPTTETSSTSLLPVDPYEWDTIEFPSITAIGACFETFELMYNYFETQARECGFDTVLRQSSNKRNGHIVCHCHHSNLTDPRKTKRMKKSRYMNCPWFARYACNDTSNLKFPYKITAFNNKHTHPPDPVNSRDNNWNSVDKFPPAVIPHIISNIRHSIRSESANLHSVSKQFNQPKSLINMRAFRYIIQKARKTMNLTIGEDLHKLCVWLPPQSIYNTHGYHVAYHTDVSYTFDRFFYQSPTMKQQCNDHFDVLVMDTTMCTNRFGYPLCLYCGVSEYGKTVLLGVGLIANQDTESFDWLFQQLQTGCGVLNWNKLRTVITDGDRAMEAAIRNLKNPNISHQHCIWHVELNVKKQCHDVLRYSTFQIHGIIDEFRKVVYATTEEDFHTKKNHFNNYFQEKPALLKYLETYIWKNEKHFASCYLKFRLTLGALSTQRAESLNSVIKKQLVCGSQTPVNELMKTLDKLSVTLFNNEIKEQKKFSDFIISSSTSLNFSYELSQSLSKWCCDIIIAEMNQIFNYHVEKFAHEQGFDWFVCTVKQGKVDDESQYRVSLRNGLCGTENDNIYCDCGHTQRLLLPCRHVMAVNKLVFDSPYFLSQVGLRWRLRSELPQPVIVEIIPESYGMSIELNSENESIKHERAAAEREINDWCRKITAEVIHFYFTQKDNFILTLQKYHKKLKQTKKDKDKLTDAKAAAENPVIIRDPDSVGVTQSMFEPISSTTTNKRGKPASSQIEPRLVSGAEIAMKLSQQL